MLIDEFNRTGVMGYSRSVSDYALQRIYLPKLVAYKTALVSPRNAPSMRDNLPLIIIITYTSNTYTHSKPTIVSYD